MSISLVVPVTKKDFQRFKILFSTFTKFTEDNLFTDFIIITPDLSIFVEFNKKKYSWCLNPVSCISDDDIINSTQMKTSWYKQQVLKLCVSKVITTNFYLICDSDTICIKPLKHSDLIDEKGRACLEYCSDRINTFQKVWMLKACACLEYSILPDTQFMNITPCILSTTIVKELCLEYSIDTLIHFIQKDLTSEYSLYYIYMLKNYKVDDFHFIGHIISTSSCWFLQDVFDFEPKFDAPFLVYQSNIRISETVISAHLHRILYTDYVYPQISCICSITSQKGLDIALESFLNQLYPNKRLYCIISKALVLTPFANVFYVNSKEEVPKSEYIHHWEEMFWYHKTCIIVQYLKLIENEANMCYITQHMILTDTDVRISDTCSLSCLQRGVLTNKKVYLENTEHILSVKCSNDKLENTWDLYEYHPIKNTQQKEQVMCKLHSIIDGKEY